MTADLTARAKKTLADIAKANVILTTQELAVVMIRPGENLNELKAALSRLAESGTAPYARKGRPVLRRIFGRTQLVKPWEWSKP